MRRAIRCTVVVAATAAFATTFFVPITRETQILIFRLLLHRPAANTRLSARPDEVMPSVRLSQAFREHLKAAQGRSADAYILAHCAGPALNAFPPAEQWRSHRLARWAVMREAERTDLLSGVRARTQPEAAAPASAEAIENTLATIRMLQIDQPWEGGLWLAEAVVLSAQGQDAEALHAVWSAINRDQWTTPHEQWFGTARSLLEASGLPRLEANDVARWGGWVDPQVGVVSRAGDVLIALTAKAMSAGEDRKVDELFITMAALSRVARERVGFGLAPEHRGGFDELIPAMAERMGRTPPPREMGSDYEAWQEARRQFLNAYLEGWVAPEAAAFFREEQGRERSTAECRICRCPPPGWMKGMPLIPGLAGACSILLMSLLVSGLIAEVPFLVAPPLRLGSREVYPAGFLFVLMVAFGIMVAVWFNSLLAISPREGVTVKGWTLLPAEGLALLSAAVFSLGVAAFRRLLVWYRGWYWGIWLGVFVLYLVVLSEAGATRIAETQRFAFSPSW